MSRILVVVLLLYAAGVRAAEPVVAPYKRLDPVANAEITVDPNAIWMENEHLKFAITTVAPHSGQIFTLVQKSTGLELGNQLSLQGFFQDRFGGLKRIPIVEGAGEIISSTEVRVVYLQTGEQDGKKIAIRHTKVYTLRPGTSYISVLWKQENVGETDLLYSPWWKHIVGMSDTLFTSPVRMVMPAGPTAFPNTMDFTSATTNWIARLTGTANDERAPMLTSLTDYRHIFQQFAWCSPPRFTLETTLNRIELKPGQSYEVPGVLTVAANLGQVGYAAPELSASVETAGPPTVGAEATLTVRIAGCVDLGERRLEGQISNAAGELIAKLPNQQVQIAAGKIASVSYPFTPPQEGVYHVDLTVFENQQPLLLGSEVNSQKSYITLPIVVGSPPATVVEKWQSENAGFPRRKPREVAPWRTLALGEVKVGQVLVPERLFPEDELKFAADVQPAQIRTAGGEYECLQFAVEVPEPADPLALIVAVSPITNDAGVVLDNVRVREQVYLTTETPSDYMNFAVGQWPDPLFDLDWVERLPEAAFAKQNIDVIRSSRKRVYWLTLQPPRDAAPGIYRGTVTLQLAGRSAGEFPVEVRVNGFSLPKLPSLRCSTGMVGWKGLKSNLTALGLSAEQAAELHKQAPDQYRRLVLEYGWTPIMFMSGAKTWEVYRDVGRGMSVFHASRQEDEAWLASNGLLDRAFTYAPFDEHTDGEIPDVIKWTTKWKQERKIPVLDCYYGAQVSNLFGLVDVWCGQNPRSPAWGTPMPPLNWGDKAIARKQAGDRFFSCNASLIWHVEYNPTQGRSIFWDDFVAGVDGRYVYSTCRWTTDLYKKNWTTGNYMGCVVYPGPRGFTTSIRLETLRDAVEDHDYLTILRERLGAAEKQGNASGELLTAAHGILDDPKLAERVKTTESLLELRNRVADLIEQLGDTTK